MATLFSRLLHIVSTKGEVEEVTAFGRWKDFIVAAERAWLNVFDAGKPTSLLSADGAPLLLLPPEFSTRRKIYSYFRRWWGRAWLAICSTICRCVPEPIDYTLCL